MKNDNVACKNCQKNFVIDPEDFAFYERIAVPPPTWCPECRLKRRLMWRNTRVLYKNTCDLCKKSMFSMYAPDKSYTVYCCDCWYGDGWDPLSYGRTYDETRPFFDQFYELLKVVPRIALFQIRTVDSDYANFILNGKHLYLSYSVVGSEYCYYSYYIDKSRECFDCFNVMESEQCYGCIDCVKCFNMLFSYKNHECMDSAYLYDCINCQDCFMSSNLRNKKFVFRNKQLTKDEYEKSLQGVMSGTDALNDEFTEMTKRATHRFATTVKVLDCTGDVIESAKNAKVCFDVYGAENVKYSVRCTNGTKDAYDVFGAGSELLYEGVASGIGSYNCKFYTYLEATRDATYVDWCQNSANVFGCSGLRKKEYCVFNRQYSPEEYRHLVEKIKANMIHDKEYGEFFPSRISPWAYNETMAQEHFPLTKETAIAQGYRWDESGHGTYGKENGKDIFACTHCRKNFRIIDPEIVFCKRFRIELPKTCPDCRHSRRFAIRNPYKLWHRKCMNPVRSDTSNGMNKGCTNEFETSYAPDRTEKIYCETCYQHAVL